jgi:NitT/TauT family transport system ATP-binding protein
MEDRAVSFARPRTLETTFKDEFTGLTNDLRRLIFAARQNEEKKA